MQRIVFASGKGGTGKTTLTALTARLLSEGGMPVMLADCDVEAANLPIALGARVTARESFIGGSKAVIDAEACSGCGACASACRFDALGPDEDYYRTRTYVVDPWACEGCAACTPTCPHDAITMVQSRAGEVIAAEASIGPVIYGRLTPGEDLSGKLVTEVRRQADEVAADRDMEHMWIDGPPGVGCPAIAAITGTDLIIGVTEPTISGEHDLMRLVTLARRFKIPVAVVLNKADLSAGGAQRLRDRVSAEGLELVAEIPYDTAVAQIPGQLARGEEFAYPETPGMDAVRGVAGWLSRRLESAG